MLRKTFALFTLLLAGTALAGQFPQEIIEQMDGTRVVTFLNDSDLAGNPDWQPLSGPPPVTIDGAAQALRDYAASHPRLADATLGQIDLKPIPRHGDSWHYLAMLNTHEHKRPKAHYFVVLMNGRVYPSIEEPDSVR